MDEQRLDTLIAAMGEMRGDMRALNSRMSQMETAFERVARHTEEPIGARYWMTLLIFVSVAVIVAAIMLWAGAPR